MLLHPLWMQVFKHLSGVKKDHAMCYSFLYRNQGFNLHYSNEYVLQHCQEKIYNPVGSLSRNNPTLIVSPLIEIIILH